MSEIGDAFERWASVARDWSDDASCCSRPHLEIDGLGKEVPKQDTSVCQRERLWREYVRKRDNDPFWPFEKPQIH